MMAGVSLAVAGAEYPGAIAAGSAGECIAGFDQLLADLALLDGDAGPAESGHDEPCLIGDPSPVDDDEDPATCPPLVLALLALPVPADPAPAAAADLGTLPATDDRIAGRTPQGEPLSIAEGAVRIAAAALPPMGRSRTVLPGQQEAISAILPRTGLPRTGLPAATPDQADVQPVVPSLPVPTRPDPVPDAAAAPEIAATGPAGVAAVHPVPEQPSASMPAVANVTLAVLAMPAGANVPLAAPAMRLEPGTARPPAPRRTLAAQAPATAPPTGPDFSPAPAPADGSVPAAPHEIGPADAGAAPRPEAARLPASPLAPERPPTARIVATEPGRFAVATDRLGPVHVAVEAHATQVGVRLTVDTAATQALLSSQTPRLADAVAAGGGRLDALAVDVRSGGGSGHPPPRPQEPPPSPPRTARATGRPVRGDRFA